MSNKNVCLRYFFMVFLYRNIHAKPYDGSNQGKTAVADDKNNTTFEAK